MNIEESLWVEKYRPKKLEDVILPTEYMEDFGVCIKRQAINNFLFYGPPGSGKSCVARILTSKNGILQHPKDNKLTLNGSSKADRGINKVETVIEPFLKIPPTSPDKQKVVFIDEGDYLTDEAIHSLRGVIEKYEKYGRFIFTCNYVSKFPEAIMSRFQPYQFKQMSMDFIESYCKNILDSEKIKYEDEQVKYIISVLYPDIRRIVNILSKNSMTGTLRATKEAVMTNEKIIFSGILEIINFINTNQENKINSVLPNIINHLNEIDLDFRVVFNDLFFKKEVPATAKIVINKYANLHKDALIPSMNFMSMVFEIIKTMTQYKQMVSK